MGEVKTTNQLMRHLRENHSISINGSYHKRTLRNIGYYHGYKGYRFIRVDTNRVNYTSFDQIIAINEFDMKLKSLFYPHIMFIETALKNYMLEIILNETKSCCFNDIYDKSLNAYQEYNINSRDYKKELNKRLILRNKIFGQLQRNFNIEKPVIKHFYDRFRDVPIWAIFEVITLGEFGHLISCSNKNIRLSIGSMLNLNTAYNGNGKLTEHIVQLLQDLRNSVAHNDVIFDVRFSNRKPNNSLVQSLERDMTINNIDFETITDYFILVIFLLKNLKVNRSELKQILKEYTNILEQFRKNTTASVFMRIFSTNNRAKLIALESYINK